MIDLNDPMSIMYLPMFDGGRPEKSGRRVTERRANPGRGEASNPPSTTTQGFSYPGPQTIISDVPEPTNRFQTLLQPGLENPPVLEPPLLIPNVVQITDASAVPRMEEPPEETGSEEPQPANAIEVQPEAPKPEPKTPEPAPKPEPKPPPPLAATPKPEPKMPEPAPKPVELPKSIPPPVDIPKPEPKTPEPAPKPEELPKPIPPPVALPKPEPKAPEPAPKPAELPKPTPPPAATPKPEPKPAETPKPEPKPLETQIPPQAAAVAKPAQKDGNAAASAEQPAVEQSKEPLDYPSTPGASRELLSLSPMPAAPGPAAAIPPGEARGRFVISPQANLTGSDAEPGLKAGTPSSEIGIGNTTGAPARKGVAPKTVPITSSKKESSIGSGGNAGRGSGNGSASGAGNGSGSSSTSGSGRKPFAGITIVGGDYEPGTDSDAPPVTKAIRPLQTAYGLNIISTEDSGGGLPFYGVFSHEQIYTVYLDMRTVESDPDPTWTLEFAVDRDSAAAPAVQNISRGYQGLALPFPAFKEKPGWPAALVRKYPGKMIIVYAVISATGKMEQVSVKESPDALLNEPVIRALSKWVFRPAQFEGQPVPAKVLLGIPLWAPE